MSVLSALKVSAADGESLQGPDTYAVCAPSECTELQCRPVRQKVLTEQLPTSGATLELDRITDDRGRPVAPPRERPASPGQLLQRACIDCTVLAGQRDTACADQRF